MKKALLSFALFLAFATGGFFAPYVTATADNVVASMAGPKPGETYIPAYTLETGSAYAVVYIGASGCGWSNHPDLVSAVEAVKVRVQEKSRREQVGFTTIGVAKDHDAAIGIDHLKKYGTFDQWIAGDSWQNEGLRRYVWDENPGKAATPQILVVRRTMAADSINAPSVSLGVAQEEVLVRKIGLPEIQAWINGGTSIPTPVDPSASLGNK